MVGPINRRLFTGKQDPCGAGASPFAACRRGRPARIALAHMGSTSLAGTTAHRRVARALSGAEHRRMGDAIDLAYLARFTLGNAALEREVLQLFAEQIPLYLEALHGARVRKAWREAAH